VKTSTINLSIPRDLLERADREAKRESRSRSEIMRDALRVYLDRRARWADIFAYGDAQVKKLGLKPEDVEEAIREVRGRR